MSTIKIKTKVPGPKARKIIAFDEKHTSTHYTRYVPLVVDRAKYATIVDVDGNHFLDFTAGIAVTNAGHCHPAVVEAIKAQADRLIHMCSGDYYNQPCADLAAELNSLWPGKSKSKVFFTNSGTESIEGAIKLARYATKRPGILAFLGAFHGRTCGSLSLTASKTTQRAGFGSLLGGVHHAVFNDINSVRTILKRTAPPEDLAAIVVEPVQGEGGYVPAELGFLQQLREICTEHGILLVCDEIQSGFLRTGKMFAVEYYGVEPDILCLAKGIAAGMPLGAVMAKAKVMDKLKPGAHGSTYGGNPVACAAALASLSAIQQMPDIDSCSEAIFDSLQKLQNKHRMHIRAIRGLGLMIGVEIHAHSKPSGELRDKIVEACFRKGLVLLGCGDATIRICPPLCLTKAQALEGMSVMEEAFEEVLNP